MTETQDSETISPQLARVEQLAREHPGRAFHALNHLLDKEWMRKAWQRTRKDGAVGVDGQTAAAFAEDLEGNLQGLVDALHAPAHVVPPVRRAHIPKGEGQTRPIGIPTFADKVLQRAVTMLLDALYEPVFDADSYGFRRGRSAHHALKKLRSDVEGRGGAWIVELDIRSYFDTIDHGHLRGFLDERVTDGVVRRMIHKWLHAGVLEAGTVTYPDEGTPQGGVLSPLLGNVYLHHVLDLWFRAEVQPRLRGASGMVRYADDAVLWFEHEQDARKVLAVLHQRFAKYGLALHPDKTKLLRFVRPEGPEDPSGPSGSAGPTARPPARTTFDLLGFTHQWRRTPRGWKVLLKTAKGRFTRTLRNLRQWCAEQLHEPVRDLVEGLSKRLRGHAQHFDVAGNRRAFKRLVYALHAVLKATLSRRSQRGTVTWPQLHAQLARTPLWSPGPTPTRTWSGIKPVVGRAGCGSSARPDL